MQGGGVPEDFKGSRGKFDDFTSGLHEMVSYDDKDYDPTFGSIGNFDANRANDPWSNWGENLDWIVVQNSNVGGGFSENAVDRANVVVGMVTDGTTILNPDGFHYGIPDRNGWDVAAFAPTGTTMPSNSQLQSYWDVEDALSSLELEQILHNSSHH